MTTHTFYAVKDGEFYYSARSGRHGVSTFPQDAYLYTHKESAEMTAVTKLADMKNPKVVKVTMAFEE